MPLRRMLRRVENSTKHKPWWVELCSGLVGVLWGVYVYFMSGDLRDSQAYAVLGEIMTDNYWAAMACFIGVFQICATLWNSVILRWTAAVMAMALWSAITKSLWSSGITDAPGTVIYFGWAFANAWPILLLRLPKEGKPPDGG